MIRTGESDPELIDWNCVTTWPEVGEIRTGETLTNFRLGTVSRINSEEDQARRKQRAEEQGFADPQPEPATNPFKKVGRKRRSNLSRKVTSMRSMLATHSERRATPPRPPRRR